MSSAKPAAAEASLRALGQAYVTVAKALQSCPLGQEESVSVSAFMDALARARRDAEGFLSEPRFQSALNEDKLSFLRTKAFFTRCMEVAYEKYDWKKQPL